MTMLLTTCFAFAVLRCIEEFGRFCFNLIYRLTIKKKVENVSVHDRSWKSISARVSPELHTMIKAHAQVLDLTITDFILIAINEKIKRANRV